MPAAARVSELPRLERATVRKEGAALLVSALDVAGDAGAGVAATLDEPGVAAAIERLAAAWRGSDLLAAERRWRRGAGTTRTDRLAFAAR